MFGLTLAILEVVRNWGAWQWWPFWVVDYIAAAMLIAGGLIALRRGATHLLCAAWSFACAMFWMSFFAHLDGTLKAGSAVSMREQSMTTATGVMLAITAVGMISALLADSSDKPRR